MSSSPQKGFTSNLRPARRNIEPLRESPGRSGHFEAEPAPTAPGGYKARHVVDVRGSESMIESSSTSSMVFPLRALNVSLEFTARSQMHDRAVIIKID